MSDLRYKRLFVCVTWLDTSKVWSSLELVITSPKKWTTKTQLHVFNTANICDLFMSLEHAVMLNNA